MVKRAILLAAGRGKRLDIFGNAKPLVRVGHKSLIVRNIEQLQDAGVEEIGIVLGFQADRVERELLGHDAIRAKLRFVRVEDWEMTNLGDSARVGLRAYSGDQDESAFIVMCDLVLFDNPYRPLAEALDTCDAAVLVGLNAEHASVCGAQSRVKCENGKVCALGKDANPSDGFEVGAYALRSSVCRQLLENVGGPADTFAQMFFPLLMEKKVGAVEIVGPWFDVNTPETCLKAELAVRKQTFFHPERAQQATELCALPTTHIFEKQKHTQTKIVVKRGLLNELGRYQIVPEESACSRHILLSERTVYGLFGESVEAGLRNAGYEVRSVVVEPGERMKSLELYGHLAEQILAEGIDERSVIFTLGGGTVANIGGFLASTLMRGIGLVHLPTTVMAQCDAAIGVKQGINGDKGKNLLGAYYEPHAILVDPDVLVKQSDRWIKDGLAECIKHALVQDASFYHFLRTWDRPVNDAAFLEQAVTTNIRLKLALMEKDMKEDREGMALQYGHEVGHAVEYLSSFSYGHGESIVFGMRVSVEAARMMDLCGDDMIEAHRQIFSQYGYETALPASMAIEAILESLKYTKKSRYGDLRLALPASLGALWHSDDEYAIHVPMEVMRKVVDKCHEPW